MSNPDFRDALAAMVEARKLADDRPDLAVKIIHHMVVMDLALEENDPAFGAARLRECIAVLAAEPDEMAELAAVVSEVVAVREAAAAAHDALPVYPAPGSPIPDQPGFVVGECEHRVAGSEWRAGFRTCERCPGDAHVTFPARPISECAGFCVGVCTCGTSYTAEAARARRGSALPPLVGMLAAADPDGEGPTQQEMFDDDRQPAR
jgi:hypothetical protein